MLLYEKDLDKTDTTGKITEKKIFIFHTDCDETIITHEELKKYIDQYIDYIDHYQSKDKLQHAGFGLLNDQIIVTHKILFEEINRYRGVTPIWINNDIDFFKSSDNVPNSWNINNSDYYTNKKNNGYNITKINIKIKIDKV